MTKIFGVTGWKNSGKTTLVSALVREFSKRGYNVSTIKHASESFNIDHEGADTHTHRLSGAGEVAVASPKRWAIMHETRDGETEIKLSEILSKLSPCDLVLIEGFKLEPHPKIECIREESKESVIYPKNKSIVALATSEDLQSSPLPNFSPEAVSEIADFITKYVELPS